MRCCCPRLALRLMSPVKSSLAYPLPFALRAPLADLQGYNYLGHCLRFQLLFCKANALPGAPGPHSRLGWSRPRPGTMDACSLSICVAQSDFLPKTIWLEVDCLCPLTEEQSCPAGKGGQSGQRRWVRGTADKAVLESSRALP